MLIVFDMDGVLADPSQRDGYAGGDWIEWNKHSLKDAAIHQGIMLLESITMHPETTVIFCTSRFDMSRVDALTWLNTHAKQLGGGHDWDIYCRPDHDPRPCHEVKDDLFREIIEDYGKTPDLFIEDNETNAKHIYEVFGVPYLICKFPTEKEVPSDATLANK